MKDGDKLSINNYTTNIEEIKDKYPILDATREAGVVFQKHGDGDYYTGKCPFHDDEHESFVVYPADRHWKCLTGCGSGSVIDFQAKVWNCSNKEAIKRLAEQIGPKKQWDWSTAKIDRIEDWGPEMRKKIYKQPDGNKKGVWEHFLGDKWIPGQGGLKSPLYRQENIPKAADTLLFWTEGPKDADSLFKLDLIATTTGGSSDRLRQEQLEIIPKNQKIVIIPDRDTAGQRYGKHIADTLQKHGCTVYVVDLPYPIVDKHGRDITDWIDDGHTRDELLTLTEEAQVVNPVPEPSANKEETEKQDKPSGSDILIGLMKEHVKLIFTNELQETYAAFFIGDVQQVHPVRSSVFKQFLTGLYYQATRKGLPGETLKQVLGVAEGMALFEGVRKPTFLRVAQIGQNITYDLANDIWQSVVVTPDGWEIQKSPSNMVRAANTMPQVEPERGGSIELLRPYLNVKKQSDFLLTAVWLAYCIAAPDLPKPIICLHGSKGSGKSTFQRVLRRLVDPAAAELTSLPSHDEGFALQCDRNYLLSFDNLSRLSGSQSDFLCTVSTGGALSKRRLYSDNEETILRFCRPVTMSGINAVAERSDLLDRCILIELERITSRQSERKFWKKFDAVKGKILGALFDAVSYSMRADDVELPELVRMADFNEIGYKLAIGLGFNGEEFLKSLHGNAEITVDAALKSHPVAVCICELVESEGSFDGSSSELHRKLDNIACKLRLGRIFPKSAASLSRSLRTLVTDLRSVGIEVEEYKNSSTKQTLYAIKKVVKISPQSPQSPQASNGAGSRCGDIYGDMCKQTSLMSPQSNNGDITEIQKEVSPQVSPLNEASNGAGYGDNGDNGDTFTNNLYYEGEIE
ncbi:MAG: CHC2 zinc finger domain-containing protein [Smithella sp.]